MVSLFCHYPPSLCIPDYFLGCSNHHKMNDDHRHPHCNIGFNCPFVLFSRAVLAYFDDFSPCTNGFYWFPVSRSSLHVHLINLYICSLWYYLEIRRQPQNDLCACDEHKCCIETPSKNGTFDFSGKYSTCKIS